MPYEAGADGNGCDRREWSDWRGRVLAQAFEETHKSHRLYGAVSVFEVASRSADYLIKSDSRSGSRTPF